MCIVCDMQKKTGMRLHDLGDKARIEAMETIAKEVGTEPVSPSKAVLEIGFCASRMLKAAAVTFNLNPPDSAEQASKALMMLADHVGEQMKDLAGKIERGEPITPPVDSKVIPFPTVVTRASEIVQ